MSGTSLDGLDMALCNFQYINKKWKFKILVCKTIKYPGFWRTSLMAAPRLHGQDLLELHGRYGNWLGKESVRFLKSCENEKVDLIASHGHTIFHRPDLGYTFQLGRGENLAAVSGIPVVYDFRSSDVALGGQGAPLVPKGDAELFAGYDACLNLGGIANISFDALGERKAFDICPVNLILNHLAQFCEMEYDRGGKFAAAGKVNEKLLKQLNGLSFYKKAGKKSLGREWAEAYFFPYFEKANAASSPDFLATAAEHAAIQLSKVLNRIGAKSVLVTGGGAYNLNLLNRMQFKTKCKLVIPSNQIIEFKEALIFAFLGVLRMRNEINILKSATGATRNSSGGVMVFP